MDATPELDYNADAEASVDIDQDNLEEMLEAAVQNDMPVVLPDAGSDDIVIADLQDDGPGTAPNKKVGHKKKADPAGKTVAPKSAIRLPLARVKAFMKMDPNIKNVSADAAYLTAKATELFIQKVAKDSWRVTEQARRKTIQANDLKQLIDTEEYLMFLEEMI